MSTMSYCRFENTAADLDDCWEHINDNDLSKDEQRARKRLIQICLGIASDLELQEVEETVEE